MAISQITYTNKEVLNENASIPDINKVKADDMNEIKSVVNGNATEQTTTNHSIGLDRDTYNQLSTYALGAIVLHENKIWECTTTVEDPELWDPAKWTEIPLLTNKINDKMLPTENSLSSSTKRSYSCDYVNTALSNIPNQNLKFEFGKINSFDYISDIFASKSFTTQNTYTNATIIVSMNIDAYAHNTVFAYSGGVGGQVAYIFITSTTPRWNSSSPELTNGSLNVDYIIIGV